MMLPDFIVIGAEKCGTTWLKHNLNEHPEIFIPSKKELHFFDDDINYQKGLEWYSEYFNDNSNEKCFGEITPAYMFFADKVAPRVKQCLMDIKLIAILRDPADRAWSNYWMNFSDNKVNLTFEQCIDQYHSTIRKSHYKSQLTEYYKHFDERQLLILDYEDIKSKPLSVLKLIFNFLGVDQEFIPKRINDRIFTSRTVKYPVIKFLIVQLGKLLKSLGLKKVVSKYGRFVKVILKKYNTKKTAKPMMSSKLRARLINLYQEDILYSEKLLGYDLNRWRETEIGEKKN